MKTLYWLPIFRKSCADEDPQRLLVVLEDLTSSAQRRLVNFRVVFVLLNSIVFFLTSPDRISDPVFGVGVMLLAWLYVSVLVLIQPLLSSNTFRKVIAFVPFLDGLFVTGWIFSTGTFDSPFYVAYYIGIVGASFNYSTFLIYSLSFYYGLMYAAVCLYQGTFSLSDMVFRSVIMIFAAAVGELIVHESVAQAISREKYRERVQESTRMQQIFKTVQEELETAVANRTHELEQANHDLELEIQRRTEIEDQLKRSVAQTESANQAKAEFLANISHEIRTPLNAVIGYSELLAERHGNSADRSLYADTVRKNGKLLGAIIGDILDLSKIDNGCVCLEMSGVSITNILGDIYSLFRPAAAEKGLQLLLKIDEDVPETVYADHTRLKQILVNLVSNAIKFTNEGKVEILVDVDGSIESRPYVRFRVVDSGIGIQSEKFERIFAPFTQIDSSTSKRYGGTGLGLTISRKIAELMCGQLVIESSAEGVGTVFALSIPAPDVVLQRAAEREVGEEILRNKEVFKGMRFLLVDDAFDNQVLLQQFLRHSGASTIDLAEDGAEAIKLGSANRYDAILMDLQMPHVDGFQATKVLRKVGIRTPIIAVTAHALTEVRERAIAEGFTGFIAKPVMRTTLVMTIADILSKKIIKPGKSTPSLLIEVQA